MSKSNKFDCKKSFLREINLIGNGGKIICEYYWMHVTVSLKSTPKFIDGRALIVDISEIDFNDSLFPRGGERWEGLDDKLDQKVQKIFDSEDQMGNLNSIDGRDKCISKVALDKLVKLGFKVTTDDYWIDKNFKDAYTGHVVSEVVQLS
jgi:hypothetical protein